MRSKKAVISAFVEKSKKEAEEQDRATRQVEIGNIAQNYTLEELRQLYQQTTEKLEKYVDDETAIRDTYDFYDYVADLAAMDHSGVDTPDFDPIGGGKDYFAHEVARLYSQAKHFLREHSQCWYWLVVDHPLEGAFFEPGDRVDGQWGWGDVGGFSQKLKNVLDVLDQVDQSQKYTLVDGSAYEPWDVDYALVRSSDLLAVDCSAAAFDFGYKDVAAAPKKRDYAKCFKKYENVEIYEL